MKMVINYNFLKGTIYLSSVTSVDIWVFNIILCFFHWQWYPLNFVIGCSFLIFLLIARFVVSNEISGIHVPLLHFLCLIWDSDNVYAIYFQGRRNKKLFWLPAIAPLLSVILSTLIVYLSKADKNGVNIIKHVKGGLNPSSVQQLQFHGPQVGQAAKIGLISAVIALTVC